MKLYLSALLIFCISPISQAADDFEPIPVAGVFVLGATVPEDAVEVCLIKEGAPLDSALCKPVSEAREDGVVVFEDVQAPNGEDTRIVAFAKDAQGRTSGFSNAAILDMTPPGTPVMVKVN